MSGWLIVHDVPFERVRRFVVPGGYLYQTEIDVQKESSDLNSGTVRTTVTGWHPAVFVPLENKP